MNQYNPKIFKTSTTYSLENDFPVYTIIDGKLFRTAFHPLGWSEHPDYDFGNDGKLYRTEYHKLGFGRKPDYEFSKDKKLYRTQNHPEGLNDDPDYEIRD